MHTVYIIHQRLYFDAHHHPVCYHADEKCCDRVMLWRPSRLDGAARKLGHDIHGTFRVIARRGLTTAQVWLKSGGDLYVHIC